MNSAIESLQLVATVFSDGELKPYKSFRDWLCSTHKCSFTSDRILKEFSDEDSLVVAEYEFTFKPSPSRDLSTLRKSVYEWCKSNNMDVAIQHDSIFRRYKRLVVFDMDSTLIKQEVIDEIAKYLDSIYPEKNVGTRVAVLTPLSPHPSPPASHYTLARKVVC